MVVVRRRCCASLGGVIALWALSVAVTDADRWFGTSGFDTHFAPLRLLMMIAPMRASRNLAGDTVTCRYDPRCRGLPYPWPFRLARMVCVEFDRELCWQFRELS